MLVFWTVVWTVGLQLFLFAILGGTVYMIVARQLRKRLERLFSDTYSENLWEGVTGLKHMGIEQTVENELRASTNKVLHKPLGSARAFPHFEGLLFTPAQLIKLPVDDLVPVDISTEIGPRSHRPLRLSMPILVSAMGYGVALSKPFSLAIAKGTALAGTAFNTGQGPILPEHRSYGKHMVVQYHGAFWRPTDEQLAVADMVEIRFGQGANAGAGASITAAELPDNVLRDFMQYASRPASTLHIPAGLSEVRSGDELVSLVKRLRDVAHGVPIAVKLAASHLLEKEVDIALRADVDAIVIDGAQAGTHGSPAILVDDFGLPTLAALCRADKHLRNRHKRNNTTLIISGRIRTPGDMLKSLALGADAVYIGASALFATSHKQILKPLPFEPPTQLAWATGTHEADFSLEEGAQSLANFLVSSSEELKSGIRALGKQSVRELDKTDLVAWDPEVARVTGLPLV